jgi:pyruvate dehydrogenase kinase 2/3/4
VVKAAALYDEQVACRTTKVNVSERRLQEFLAAEMVHLAGNVGTTTITVDQILEHSTTVQLASLIALELPARFAARILQLEATCSGWREIPGMIELHDLVSESFCKLRMVSGGTLTKSDLPKFTDVALDVGRRHTRIVPLMCDIAKALNERGLLADACIDDWLGQFFNSRIGTEMLLQQYITLLEPPAKGDLSFGIVEPHCNPAQVCRDAIDAVKNQKEFNLGSVRIKLHVQSDTIKFSFMSTYLFQCVEELLRNSVVATLAHLGRRDLAAPRHSGDGEVVVSVCADEHHVVIRVRDRAGGIPEENMKNIWKYMFSTTQEDLSPKFRSGSLISGPGIGLPLCRLYAQYLGGNLKLLSLPGIGTDVYLSFHRIDFPGLASSMFQAD